jgi:hypothetical protein
MRFRQTLLILTTSFAILQHGLARADDGDKAKGIDRMLSTAVGELRPATGILYDRVVGLSRIAEYDGRRQSPPVSRDEWRQLYHEMSRAALRGDWPPLTELTAQLEPDAKRGVISIAVMDAAYDRIREDAIETGALIAVGDRLVRGQGDAFVEQHVFAVSAMKDYTHRGSHVVFRLDERAYFTNRMDAVRTFSIDFGDGNGWQGVRLGAEAIVTYRTTGHKLVRVRAVYEDGIVRHGAFPFRVANLIVPNPHDTIAITATIPYASSVATGEAYVYLAPGHTALSNPVIAVEGFDIDNSMNWDELYDQVNQENLIEDARAMGFDAVVLNFTEAGNFIQRNAFLVVELLQQVQAQLFPHVTVAVIGASMGGLVTRYALAYMEQNAIEHRVRTFISFDSPHDGANVPLGM